jgi:hypothetical protein
MVDPPYCIDIDSVEDLEAAGQALAAGKLDIDIPADVGGLSQGLKLPAVIDLVVFDFDGVFTDNRASCLLMGERRWSATGTARHLTTVTTESCWL